MNHTFSANLIKRGRSFSTLWLIIFAIIFSAVCGIILWRSFAASTTGSAVTRMNLRFKPGTTEAQRNKIYSDNNISEIKEIPQIDVKVISVPTVAVSAVTNALSHNPAVDFIEQDQVVKPQEQLPNDPYFPQQVALGGGAWGWYQTHTTQAWDITQGNPIVKIAILDTGFKNSGLADFNGQIDSTWNVLNNSTDTTSNAGNHGTYVAGITGLAAGNGIGSAGFCPKCRLMIIQVGLDSGANLSDIAAGLTYAADHGSRIANMSWAGTSNSSTLSSATAYAHNKGMVMFAAAGNSNCDCTTYPSASPYVLGVAGTDNSGNKAGDSNFGSWVQVAAPEGNMTSWPTINGQPGYAPVGGTSSASPAAAGIAGLLFSYNPGLTNTQVEQALENTATPVNFSTAHGRLDSLAALQSLGAVDSQPSSAPVQTAAGQLYNAVNGLTTIAPLTTAPQVGQELVRGIGGWSGSSGLSITSPQWQRCDSGGNACTNLTSLAYYTVQSADSGSTIRFNYTVKNAVGSVPISLLSQIVGGSSSTPTMGDINADGKVDILDLSILLSKYATADAASDINHDGIVDILDLSILLSDYGQ